MFEVPLAFLLDERNRQRRTRAVPGAAGRLLRVRVPGPGDLGRHRRACWSTSIECSHECSCHHCRAADRAMAPARRAQERLGRARRLGGVARARVQRRRAPPRHGGLAGGVLPPVAIAILLHALLSAASGVLALAFDIARAVPDARLPPVQPLLHRHPARDQGGRHRARARRCSTSGAAPRAWCARARR